MNYKLIYTSTHSRITAPGPRFTVSHHAARYVMPSAVEASAYKSRFYPRYLFTILRIGSFKFSGFRYSDLEFFRLALSISPNYEL